MRALPLAALAFAATLAGARLHAQAPERRPLSLREALALAERGNPQLRQTANDVAVREAQRRQAAGGYLPELSASLGFNGSGSQTFTGEDDFGNPIRGEQRTIRSSSASQGVSLSMTLFDGGARERRLGAARQELRASEAAVAARRSTLHAQVATQYARAQAAQARVTLEERLVATARQQFDATQRRFGIAAANREDVLGSEADLARAEAQLENARGEARKAALELRQTLGVEEPVEFTLADTLVIPVVAGALDADSLVQAALAAHPTLAAARARAEAAERGAAAARGARWPSVSATAGYSRSDRSENFGSFFDVNPGGSRGFTFGLSTRLPLFDNFRTSASVAQADAQHEDAREEVRAERLRIDREVRAAVIDLENARRGLRLAERAAALSRERVELAQVRYESGAMDFVQFQTVVRSAADAERQEVDARTQLAVAWVQLQEKLGAPIAP